MNRGVWIGALVLGLGGVLGHLDAQVIMLRPVTRPEPPPTKVRGVSGAVAMGLPVAGLIPPAQDSEPRPFPPAYRQVAVPTTPPRFRPGIEPIATVPVAGGVIATSMSAPAVLPPLPESSEPESMQGELFASDRLLRTSGLGTREPITQLGQPTLIQAPLMPPGAEAPRQEVPGNVVTSLQPGNWKMTQPVSPPEPVDGPFSEHGGDKGHGPTYVRAEYLLWWTKNDRTPVPLATSGTTNFGRLGFPDTRVLIDGVLDRNPFSGARFTIGHYLDECEGTAIELSGFFLGQKNASAATNPAEGVVSRPFFNVNRQMQDIESVAIPRNLCGQVTVDSPSQLWGVEPNYICKWKCGCDYRIDLLAGARYLNLRESLTINETIAVFKDQFANNDPGMPTIFTEGLMFSVSDRFATRNSFYGGQVGIQTHHDYGAFTIDTRFKLAAGVTHQQLTINGSQSFDFTNAKQPDPPVPPAPPASLDTRPGGLYAVGSNIGSYDRDRFSLVPEVGIAVGCAVSDCCRLTLGYNFMYWSSVARPGDQIDPNLDVTLIPNFTVSPKPAPVNPPRPAVLFKDTDYWAQGLTAGIEFRW